MEQLPQVRLVVPIVKVLILNENGFLLLFDLKERGLQKEVVRVRNNMHDVRIHQLNSMNGSAYLNVIDNEYGKVELWTHLNSENPAYLIQDKNILRIIIFDSEDYANEWLDKFEGAYEKIQRINPLV